jgi:hypothetical protein
MENDKVVPLAWIPNREGFKLVLHAKDGQKLDAVVCRHPKTQLHYCDFIGPYRWADFIGWKPAKIKIEHDNI